MIIIALIFGGPLLYGYSVTDGRILRTELEPWQEAAALVTPIVLVSVFRVASGLRLNFFAAPSQSYLSTALSGASVPVRTIINTILAPGGENIVIIGAGFFLFEEILPSMGIEDVNNRVIVTSVTMAIGFAYLHGAGVGVGFLIVAAGFMAIILYATFGEDLGLFNVPLVEFSLLFGIGLHAAVNISGGGGLLAVASDLFRAEKPILYIVWIWTGYFLLAVVYALYSFIRHIPSGRLEKVMQSE